MQIIAVTGAKGAGKTTASRVLVEQHGFVRMRFADPIKRMLRAMGLGEANIDGDCKETPVAMLGGRTARYALQTLGTEWGRQRITSDLWVNVMRSDIMAAACQNPGVRIVIDDMRFPNEDQLMCELGATKWRIRRPEVEPKMSSLAKWLARRGLHPTLHASETYWPDIPVHVEIVNDWSFDTFEREVSLALRRPPVLTVEETVQ